MILLFDVGNTRIKWALAAGGVLADSGAVQHRDREWELPAQLAAAPARALAISVAGPDLNQQLSQRVHEQWGVELEFLHSSAAACGVRNGYREPARLGVDRWAAVVAAHRRAGAACVVDCGSAVTFDTVASSGEHLGGLILPGLAMMRRALNQDAHQLALAEAGALELFARDTLTAIRSGTQLGLAALIDGLTEQAQVKLGEPLTVFMTGGDADALRPYLRTRTTGAPDLVLEGLALLAEGEG